MSHGLAPSSNIRRLRTACLGWISFWCTAALLPASPPTIHTFDDDVNNVTEFFDTVLPPTLRQNHVAIDFVPRFADFRSREFARYPFELRYVPADNLEIFAGIVPFSPNPLNSGPDHRWGIGETFFGFRRNVYDLPFFDQASFGLETQIPLGNPPIDLIDGYLHVQPFMTGTRKLDWHNTEFYIALSYDRALNTPDRDRPTDPRIDHEHIFEATPGLLYKPSQFGYFTEYDFEHLREDIGVRLSHGGRVGIIWDVPRERSRAWHFPGKWQIESAFQVVKQEGRQVEYGIDTHVRVQTTLHEVMHSDLANYITLAK